MKRLAFSLKIALFLFLFTGGDTYPQVFTKITDANNPIVSSPDAGGYYKGASWVDVDNDGLLDLYVCGGQVFKNLGNGSFAIIPNSFPSNLGSIIGNSWADYDNDGNIDCFLVANVQSQPRSGLYRNDGQGHFTKITSGSIADSVANTGWGCTWGDVNNDGYPDLVIAAAINFQGVNHTNRFFINNQDGTFTRIDTTGITAVTAPYTIPVFSDYDQDGDIDLFIGSGPANGTPARDYLFKNYRQEQTTSFYFQRIDSGILGTDLLDGQNWNWIDYDNDGDLDAFVTNYSANIPNVMYRCDGPGQYTKLTQADVGDIVSYHPGSSLSNTWGDFDNDGNIDCIITNDASAKCFYYRNNGNGTFTRLDSIDNLIGFGPHIGATAADYDYNGTLDLYISGPVNARGLFRNDTQNGNKWVNIKFNGAGPPAGSNKSALGTIVKAKATINGSPKWQMREINAQNGFNSMNMLNVHFGFGNAVIIDSLIVKWPRGLTQVFTNVEPNRFYSCTEGGMLTQVVIGVNQISGVIPSRFKLYQNYPNPFNPSTKIKFALPKQAFVQITIYDINGRVVSKLLDRNLKAGVYETDWNASSVSSGIYFCRLSAGAFTDTKKLALIK